MAEEASVSSAHHRKELSSSFWGDNGEDRLHRNYDSDNSMGASQVPRSMPLVVMGWYSKLRRDEVVAEWRKAQGEMSLHVHCHISGTNFLHMLIANLRFQIFQKELPLVLEAFMHGDTNLFKKHPELQGAPVWVHFHSNMEEYNRVECWGFLVDATKRRVLLKQPNATD